ncbi:undecaprenyldiphospho-muramoylpentapeptide beta-N-acetylglucosaminyltransferase [Futiania mangrovi]|uniref:UDP-N-acetylglucosamine--N-acetylmuramyl-(pentapeptide) pyrophosphoryl-undecaprenol N-acetylglucosamine transferase n=1 Tax=Futiania mangrovi TaxID=2959716 RepID=A0A9J6P9L1_9PROT|nr:undecaprenyldiphospho-muramoylpentapeptide beta-N-acetylglucosaminyltransferase [Futiania mangrovii]MCP1334953.1 undecaprenyldiphospho-muramoylpentapeptide beta-N-acetylglucosaminyltransferase [Futiania mangrovii]
MTEKRAIALAAGGTGGHLFPAEALARALVDRGHRIVLVTDRRGLAWADRIPAGTVVEVPAATLSGGPAAKLGAGLTILKGVFQARRALKAAGACAVVGFGGYPSFPACAAAALLRLPLVLHEQNAILGRTNRALCRLAHILAVSHAETAGVPPRLRARVRHVGNPVRPEIAQAATAYAAPEPGAPIHLLVIGGSQGAQALTEAVPEALAHLAADVRARLRVAMQARAEGLELARATLADAGIEGEVAPFFDRMGERLASAHLVIARAGASTVAELAVAGRPSILVPLPSAMDDQQTLNAAALEQAGGGALLPQGRLDTLGAMLAELLSSPNRLQAMATAASAQGAPQAADALADLVETLADGATPAPAAAPIPREGRA